MNQADIQMDCIGTLALHPDLFRHCILEASYFTEGLSNIFHAISDYYRKTGVIVTTELLKYKGFNLDVYMKCQDAAYSGDVDRFNHVQRLVIDRYKERRIASLAEQLKHNAIDLSEYDQEYRKVIDLHLSETSRLTVQDLMEACKDDKKNIFFSRFRKLGALMRLKENDFMIVAGMTGGGKSGLAMNLVEDLSTNYRCLYFNLEMVPQELLQRLIAIKSGLLQDSVSKLDKLAQGEQNRAGDAINAIAQREIHVINTSQTLDTIRAAIAANNSDQHMIVVIDHIGLIGTKARSSYERMTEVAKELRKYSLDFNCTIIGLCQLNRDAGKSSDGPKLSMLRDSGEVEQSASKVLFVWNDESGHSLVLLKNRSGSLGTIDIDYNKGSQRMVEYG